MNMCLAVVIPDLVYDKRKSLNYVAFKTLARTGVSNKMAADIGRLLLLL